MLICKIRAMQQIISINQANKLGFSINFDSQSSTNLKSSNGFSQILSKQTLTGNDYWLNHYDSDNPFKNSPYDKNSQDFGKRIVHFSNREGQRFPKMALNHAAVYLDNRCGIVEEKTSTYDDIPDENIDERSLSRVRESLISRGSITGKLSQITSTNDLFKDSNFKLDRYSNAQASLWHIQNFNSFKYRWNERKSSKVDKLNTSCMSTGNVIANVPPWVPTTEVLLKNQNAMKTIRNSKAGSGLLLQRFLSMITKYHKTMKQSTIKQLSKTAFDLKIRKIQSKKKKKWRPKIKRKLYAATRVIQRAYKIRKAKRGLKKAWISSHEMMGLSPFQNFKMYIKAYMLAWKTRKIMAWDSIQNYKRQIIELSEYYGDQNNKYVLKSKEDYINAINRALTNKNWWADLISSKSIQERKERLQKIREKKQNYSKVTNNYHSNEGNTYSKPRQDISNNVGKGTVGIAFDFSRTSSTIPKSYEEEQEIERKKKVEENKQKK